MQMWRADVQKVKHIIADRPTRRNQDNIIHNNYYVILMFSIPFVLCFYIYNLYEKYNNIVSIITLRVFANTNPISQKSSYNIVKY